MRPCAEPTSGCLAADLRDRPSSLPVRPVARVRSRLRRNRPGFGHIAFVVPDVATALDAVVAEGGGVVGETVTLQTADGRRVTWVYVTDPEGNIVELQSWSEG